MTEAEEEAGRLHGLLRARHGELEARASELRRLQVGLRLVKTFAPGACGERSCNGVDASCTRERAFIPSLL